MRAMKPRDVAWLELFVPKNIRPPSGPEAGSWLSTGKAITELQQAMLDDNTLRTAGANLTKMRTILADRNLLKPGEQRLWDWLGDIGRYSSGERLRCCAQAAHQ